MAEEELVDFGFSAVTADEYEADNTDGENTGSGGSASPDALASMDSKIEQIMAHLATQKDLPSSDFGDSVKAGTESLGEKLNDVELKIDKILSLEQDEERAQTTADILAQLNDATGDSRIASSEAKKSVGKQDEIMKFLESMSPKIDKILKLESLESLLEGTSGKLDGLADAAATVTAEPPDLSPILEKMEFMDKDIQKILKMEQLEAVQSLQKSSQDMSTVVKEIEERKKDLGKTYKARMLAIEKLVFPLITNLQKDGDTKEYIKWPNRIEILEAQKTKIMQVTRSEI
jgi:hypothetical protein